MNEKTDPAARRHPAFIPVPKHLAECLGPLEWFDDNSYIEGDLICPCGAWQFEFFYPGQTHHPASVAEPIPCVAKVREPGKGEDYVFGIDAACVACKRRVSIFDSPNHGRELCPSKGNRRALDRSGGTAWKCSACGKEPHQGRVHFRFLDKEDYLEEFEGVCGEARWGDAFHWFGIAIQCCNCGHRVDPWAGYECG